MTPSQPEQWPKWPKAPREGEGTQQQAIAQGPREGGRGGGSFGDPGHDPPPPPHLPDTTYPRGNKSAVPSTRQKHMGQYMSLIGRNGWHIPHCQRVSFRAGEISPPSLKATLSHECSRPRTIRSAVRIPVVRPWRSRPARLQSAALPFDRCLFRQNLFSPLLEPF